MPEQGKHGGGMDWEWKTAERAGGHFPACPLWVRGPGLYWLGNSVRGRSQICRLNDWLPLAVAVS